MSGKAVFCKFLSANDSGETGGHQCGVLVSKSASSIMFSGLSGSDQSREAKIAWQDGSETTSRFIYYKSKNELRITRFGKGFSFLRPDETGSLFVFVKISDEFYKAFFLDLEDDIDGFLDAFGISPSDTNRLIDVGSASPIPIASEIDRFAASLKTFPTSEKMSEAARKLVGGELSVTNPDSQLLAWTGKEYELFQALERTVYGPLLKSGFPTVDSFVDLANRVLNRRKSRAGKSLENHLAQLFLDNKLEFTAQATTEEKKRPDFIFPSEKDYRDAAFPKNMLISLAAKTTCKDRWRQIINEADRTETKYLCTLQQGVTSAQMAEMRQEGVVLVVPQKYITYFPRENQKEILTLRQFIIFVKAKEKITI
jgi:type II restriction enzyme